jgi:hypothetical protein
VIDNPASYLRDYGFTYIPETFVVYLSLFREGEVVPQTIAIAFVYIQGVPAGKMNILGGHSIGHSKKKKFI